MRGPSRLLACSGLLLVGVAACGTGDGTGTGGVTASPSAPATSTATDGATATGSPTGSTPTDGTPTDGASPADPVTWIPLAQDSATEGIGSATVTGVRVGEHEGYDRVVIDITGETGDTPGWFAVPVDSPQQEFSGELLDVDGDTFLNLSITGIANGAEGPVDSAGRAAFTGVVDGEGQVAEVYVGGAWEATAQVLIGLDEDVTEYAVQLVADPLRVVVDVR